MIKVKNCAVKLKGTLPEVLAELTLVVVSVNNFLVKNGLPGEAAKDGVRRAFDAAFMSLAELKAATAEMKAELAAMTGGADDE